MDHFTLLFLLALSSLSFYLFIILFKTRTRSSSSCSTPRGLKPYPILGHLPQFLANLHRFHDWITDALSATPTPTLTFRRLGGIRGIITAHPPNVEHILRSNFDNYPKGPRFTAILQDFLGRGIFNSDGPLWHHQRKTASFEFNTRSLRNFVLTTVRHETLSRLLPLLLNSAADARVVDLQDLLQRFAFDNVCKVAFGVDPACLADDDNTATAAGNLSSGFAEAFDDAANLSAGRFRYAIPGFWKIKKLLRIGSERRLAESIATIHDFALQIIRSRKKEIQMPAADSLQSDDLLSRFMTEDADEYFLRDIIISFILAGRETTSSALTWFFWLLSSRPDVERRILNEIGSIRGRRPRGGGEEEEEAFDYEELREMHYLHAAISEAMRLYPPVPVNSTICMEDDVLPDGTVVRRGWFASYNSYAMGRMEGVWGADCREYRPERWLDLDDGGKFRPESPFKFVVFHAGPRMCLGKEMAYIQMKSIAACVLERMEVEVVDRDTCPQQMLSLTLRMKGGLQVRVRERRTAGIA